MKYQKLILVIAISVVGSNIFGQSSVNKVHPSDRIQIAFLLDVSGSMDQLILKTKSQFWRMVHYIGTGIKSGEKPIVEFALITYGSDIGKGYYEVLADFSTDTDSVAIKLHEIEVNGGDEYCWTTIDHALDQLKWSQKKGDLKIIIIAGNESFNQEKIDSKAVINKADKFNVVINTIYCAPGDGPDEIANEWKVAAEAGGGSFFGISLKDSVNMKENFLDRKLFDFNDKLNESYVPFGVNGEMNYSRMLLQDKNASLSGIPFFRERVYFKASDSFFNPSWDLIDAYKSDSTIIQRLNDAEVNSLGFKNKADLNESLMDKSYTRDSYKEVIRLRYEMIMRYLGDQKGDKDIDAAVKQILDKEGKEEVLNLRKL